MLFRIKTAIRTVRMLKRGFENHLNLFAPNSSDNIPAPRVPGDNRLKRYFDAHSTGRGIWKWNHYFDVYERHFRSFVGRDVHIMEIGVYSGGSLDMWKTYFGSGCRVYGVDIEPACREYDCPGTTILIGDQEDRGFWRDVKRKVPTLDIVVDDGGHLPEQQIVSLEELLPHLRPGGVYLCEDVHGRMNDFATYVSGVAHHLNASKHMQSDASNQDRRIVATTTSFQAAVNSIHLYPYVVVVERSRDAVTEFVAPKRGTSWKPHLS